MFQVCSDYQLQDAYTVAESMLMLTLLAVKNVNICLVFCKLQTLNPFANQNLTILMKQVFTRFLM